MSVAASAGRPTRVRPVDARVPTRRKMNVMARRAMQDAAIPTSVEVHRAAAIGALTPSFMLPEDRKPYKDAVKRAEMARAAASERLSLGSSL